MLRGFLVAVLGIHEAIVHRAGQWIGQKGDSSSQFLYDLLERTVLMLKEFAPGAAGVRAESRV